MANVLSEDVSVYYADVQNCCSEFMGLFLESLNPLWVVTNYSGLNVCSLRLEQISRSQWTWFSKSKSDTLLLEEWVAVTQNVES